MPVKQFQIISPGFDQGDETNQLVLEAGSQHLACMIRSGEGVCVAMELYNFAIDETSDYEQLISSIESGSALLRLPYRTADLFINNEYSVLIPAFKFNTEIAEDYLRIAFGDLSGTVKAFDKVEPGHDIMNAYRIPQEWFDVLKSKFRIANTRHCYTSIITASLQVSSGIDDVFVQFYHAHIIVCAVQEKKLVLIQRFEYQEPDDVIYYLLNLCNQLNLSSVGLYVSGMIYHESHLYKELVKYFENVQTVTSDSEALQQATGDYPAHFFTPICNLSV